MASGVGLNSGTFNGRGRRHGFSCDCMDIREVWFRFDCGSIAMDTIVSLFGHMAGLSFYGSTFGVAKGECGH